MTATLLSLISILIGIVGANLTPLFKKKYTFGFIGNTIIGVFGSIFFIKSFARLGFDPVSILETGTTNILLFLINALVSFFGAILFVILAHILNTKINRD